MQLQDLYPNILMDLNVNISTSFEFLSQKIHLTTVFLTKYYELHIIVIQKLTNIGIT